MIDINVENREQCCGCTACAEICPVKCITMNKDKMGFAYPNINIDLCIQCGMCERVCPELLDKNDKVDDRMVYAAFSSDVNTRMNSSSGGVFSLLAKRIIQDDGVVFGAAYTEKYESVCHIAINSISDITKVRGSKYLQSDLKHTYAEVKKYLCSGKKVLFSGTPCQIEGLHSYLMKDYENLFLIDFICHGVPAPYVWKEYKKYLEIKNNGNVKNVSFRDKRNGWSNYCVNVTFDNGKEYVKEYKNDLFMKGFLRDYYLRPSCYQCSHKGINHTSDITLGDFWGVEKYISTYNDNKGISAIIISSKKGEWLFDQISKELTFSPINIDDVLENNSALIKSAKIHNGVMLFEREFQTYSINDLLKKYCSKSFYTKAMKSLKYRINKYILKKR